jgi:hypothetical protein
MLKETEHIRGTHHLLSRQRGSSQDTEKNQIYEGHSLSVAHKEGQGQALQETKCMRGTHQLSGMGQGQYTERK